MWRHPYSLYCRDTQMDEEVGGWPGATDHRGTSTRTAFGMLC